MKHNRQIADAMQLLKSYGGGVTHSRARFLSLTSSGMYSQMLTKGGTKLPPGE